MATRTIIQLVDDFDFTEGAETHTFSFDGVAYEIDLNDRNYETMRKDFARYVDSARRTTKGGKQRKVTRTEGQMPKETSKAPVGTKEQNDAIRAWARKRGMTVSNRGRIRKDIVDKFHESDVGNPAFSSVP